MKMYIGPAKHADSSVRSQNKHYNVTDTLTGSVK